MPEKDTSKPAPAKVAAPKKTTKKKAEDTAVAKRVNETTAKKSVLKEPYNFRTRSLARAIINAVDGDEDKKAARQGLKGLTEYADIKAFALKNVVDSASQWEDFLAAWFANGAMES